MPKYFRSENEMLYVEALATFIIIDALLKGDFCLYATNRMIKIYRNAQQRCARRFKRL